MTDQLSPSHVAGDAGTLSKPMRDAIGSTGIQSCTIHPSTRRALRSRGILTESGITAEDLTPLGHRVRAFLLAQSMDALPIADVPSDADARLLYLIAARMRRYSYGGHNRSARARSMALDLETRADALLSSSDQGNVQDGMSSVQGTVQDSTSAQSSSDSVLTIERDVRYPDGWELSLSTDSEHAARARVAELGDDGMLARRFTETLAMTPYTEWIALRRAVDAQTPDDVQDPAASVQSDVQVATSAPTNVDPLSGHPGDAGHPMNTRSVARELRAQSPQSPDAFIRSVLVQGDASSNLLADLCLYACQIEHGPFLRSMCSRGEVQHYALTDDASDPRYGEARMWRLAKHDAPQTMTMKAQETAMPMLDVYSPSLIGRTGTTNYSERVRAVGPALDPARVRVVPIGPDVDAERVETFTPQRSHRLCGRALHVRAVGTERVRFVLLRRIARELGAYMANGGRYPLT